MRRRQWGDGHEGVLVCAVGEWVLGGKVHDGLEACGVAMMVELS